MREYYRVAYPRAEWSRADAWINLSAQQIPGCPDKPRTITTALASYEMWFDGWEKDHTSTEWAYVYWGASIPKPPPRNAGRVGVGNPNPVWERFLDEQFLGGNRRACEVAGMTYPRTPEQQARSLGARIACEAFNACGSLDARKCQELGDDFGTRIAELVRSASWETALKKWAEAYVLGPYPHDFYREQIYGLPLKSYLKIPQDLDTFAGISAPTVTAWAPLVSHEDAVRIGREVHEDYLAAKAEAERIGAELDELSRRKARGIVAEPSYMRCFVCGKHRGRQVREACGHDTGDGSERRWYCSRECGDR